MKCLIEDRYEIRGIVVEVDFIRDGSVFYRRWSSGSDGTAQGDWDHFLEAGQMDLERFQRAVGEGR